MGYIQQFNLLFTVCHPYLWIQWFNSLGQDKWNKAWALFTYIYEEYKKDMPSVQDVPVGPIEVLAEDDDFLATVGKSSLLSLDYELSALP